MVRHYRKLHPDTSPEGLQQLRQELLEQARAEGWQTQGKVLCPGCVGRRTDRYDSEDRPVPVSGEERARYEKFMSIKASPAEIARFLTRQGRGVVFTGTAKREMAKNYAEQSRNGSPLSSPPTITDAMVDEMIALHGVKDTKKGRA